MTSTPGSSCGPSLSCSDDDGVSSAVINRGVDLDTYIAFCYNIRAASGVYHYYKNNL